MPCVISVEFLIHSYIFSLASIFVMSKYSLFPATIPQLKDPGLLAPVIMGGPDMMKMLTVVPGFFPLAAGCMKTGQAVT
jgi:hypothetical protein